MDGDGGSRETPDDHTPFLRSSADLQFFGRTADRRKTDVFTKRAVADLRLDLLHDLFINRNHQRTVDNDMHMEIPPLYDKRYLTHNNCCQLLYAVLFEKVYLRESIFMWLESMSGGGILNIKFNDNISTENCTFYFGGESYVSSQLYLRNYEET